MTPLTTNAVLVERMEAVRNDLADIKASIILLTANAQSLSTEYAREHARLADKVAESNARVDRHESKLELIENVLKQLRDDISPLKVMYRINVFVVSGAAVAVVGLIFAILTHQVEIVHP
jgi:chromosome segregation ATPase